ncbi:MAG: hypothetical protein PSV13_08125 [Lacunisphaera sp.]|nr:hypothetical protein [Lacunisphaera sp.]
MISLKLKILIGIALLADTVSRAINLLRIVWCSASVVAIIITAWRDDYTSDVRWIAAVFTSVVLVSKLVRWLRIEF